MIVLWEQYVDSNGYERKRWLAYKDMGMVSLFVPRDSSGELDWDNYQKQRLDHWTQPGGLIQGTYEYDEYLLGLQPDWEYDGIYINDLSTIGVRVQEVIDETGTKKNVVKVFYGDASTYYTSRNPDDVPYNKENQRGYRSLPSPIARDETLAHYTDEDHPHYGGKFPVWPPEDINAWSESDDLFTLIGTESGVNQYLKWDALNSAATGRVAWGDDDGANDYRVLVLPNFTTPGEGEGAAWEDRNEIGIHVFGNFQHRSPHSEEDDNEYAVFADFSARFIHTTAGLPGTFVPPIQY